MDELQIPRYRQTIVDTLWKGRAACNVEAILAACDQKVKFFSAADTPEILTITAQQKFILSGTQGADLLGSFFSGRILHPHCPLEG
jgi:hypothetical protein